MAKKRQDPYEQQADAASIVRYGPELSSLTALLHAAEQSYADRVAAARAARESTVASVGAAAPQVQATYGGAQAAVAPAFAQGGGVEAQALTARLGEAQALAQSQLSARRVSAVEGFGAARDQALRDFRTDRQKIGERSTDLAREAGAYKSQMIGEGHAAEAEADAQQQELAARLGQSERNSIRSSGVDPDTGAPIPGGKLDPAKKKAGGSSKSWVTNDQQQAASAEIQRLVAAARGEMTPVRDPKTGKTIPGASRAELADMLLQGVPESSEPVYETVNGKRQKKLNPDGTPVTKADPGLKGAKSQLLLSAALDMAYDGHLSRRNTKLLHDNGIKIEPLGLVTYDEWKKRQDAELARNGYAPGQRPT